MSWRKLKINLVVLSVMMLSACISPLQKFAKGGSSGDQQRTSTLSNEAILTYIDGMLIKSGDAQKQELTELNQMLQINKQNNAVRTKLALLYGLPNSRVRDVIKAQSLLDDLLKDKSLDNDHKILVSILRDYLTENLKLNQKLRDEQKRADSLQIKADISQQRADSLQQKLDELKSIEKTMVDRGQRKGGEK